MSALTSTSLDFFPIPAIHLLKRTNNLLLVSLSLSSQQIINLHILYDNRFNYNGILLYNINILYLLVSSPCLPKCQNKTLSYLPFLSPFQRFIPLSVYVFSFRSRHSVSAFYPDPCLVSSCQKILSANFGA